MTSQPAPAPPVGLAPGMRYKCTGCGNLTRFDVAVTERGVRFWHAEVSGEGRVESVADASLAVESVTCRWCGSADHITTEPAPIGGTSTEGDGDVE